MICHLLFLYSRLVNLLFHVLLDALRLSVLVTKPFKTPKFLVCVLLIVVLFYLGLLLLLRFSFIRLVIIDLFFNLCCKRYLVRFSSSCWLLSVSLWITDCLRLCLFDIYIVFNDFDNCTLILLIFWHRAYFLIRFLLWIYINDRVLE